MAKYDLIREKVSKIDLKFTTAKGQNYSPVIAVNVTLTESFLYL